MYFNIFAGRWAQYTTARNDGFVQHIHGLENFHKVTSFNPDSIEETVQLSTGISQQKRCTFGVRVPIFQSAEYQNTYTKSKVFSTLKDVVKGPLVLGVRSRNLCGLQDAPIL